MICIDLFRTKRRLFESNFPIDMGMVRYRIPRNTSRWLTADSAEDEKQALVAGTARRNYRLSNRPA